MASAMSFAIDSDLIRLDFRAASESGRPEGYRNGWKDGASGEAASLARLHVALIDLLHPEQVVRRRDRRIAAGRRSPSR